MGTASLVFGLILIGFGLYLLIDLLTGFQFLDEEDQGYAGLVFLIIIIPMFVVGGLLLGKFDRDRKKEKID